MTLDPSASRCGRRLTTVIGLRPPGSYDCIGAVAERVPDQEFQLSGFVSSGCQTGQVIPLDPNLWATEGLAESRKLFNRSWQVRQSQARALREDCRKL